MYLYREEYSRTVDGQPVVFYCIVDSDNPQPARKDKTSGYVGFPGLMKLQPPFGKMLPAMLWFIPDDNPEKLLFKKGEHYFPAIDKTYSEIKRYLSYDLSTFEPADTEGKCMEGNVRYKGGTYAVYASRCDDSTWEEAIIEDLALELARIKKGK